MISENTSSSSRSFFYTDIPRYIIIYITEVKRNYNNITIIPTYACWTVKNTVEYSCK